MYLLHMIIIKKKLRITFGILKINYDPIVSVDVIGSSSSSIFDVPLSNVYDHMIRIVSWYDNEAGYSNRLLELSKRVC